MLISSRRLLELIEGGVINADPEFVNAASIDIHLGDRILVESQDSRVVDLSLKEEGPVFEEVIIPPQGVIIFPKTFFLGHTVEEFNLPPTISADLMLRSSVARAGLEHLHAGWADAGFSGAQLTLEFVNVTQFHPIRIYAGMRIAQMRFFEHEHAGEYCYSIKGNYNHQRGVQRSKGVK